MLENEAGEGLRIRLNTKCTHSVCRECEVLVSQKHPCPQRTLYPCVSALAAAGVGLAAPAADVAVVADAIVFSDLDPGVRTAGVHPRPEAKTKCQQTSDDDEEEGDEKKGSSSRSLPRVRLCGPVAWLREETLSAAIIFSSPPLSLLLFVVAAAAACWRASSLSTSCLSSSPKLLERAV